MEPGMTSVKRSAFIRQIAIFAFYAALACMIARFFHFRDLYRSIYTLTDQYYPAFWWKDSTFFVWCYEWWPYAISHGLNPFLTNHLWFPHETNLAQVTSIPTLAIAMGPVTLLWSPLVSYNIIQILTPAINSYCSFLFTNRITRQPLASIICAPLFGFSPYVMGHAPLHPNLSFIALIPLGLYLFAMWHEGKLSHISYIILSSIVIAAQAGISLEMLALGAIAAAIAVAVNFELVTINFIKVMAGVVVLSLLLMSPLVYYFLVNGSHSATVPFYSATGADLLYVILPLPQILIRFMDLKYTTIDVPEESIYMGIFTIIALASSWRSINRKTLIILLMFFGISLGSPVIVAGSYTSLLNPLALLHHLPLMDHSVLGRFGAFMWLPVSVAFTQTLKNNSTVTKSMAVVSFITLVPNPEFGKWFNIHSDFIKGAYSPIVPQVFLSKENIKKLEGKSFIALPLTSLTDLWQAFAGMKFRMLGGYTGLYYPAPPFPRNDSALIGPLQNQGKGTADDAWAASLTTFCQDNNIDGIIMDPNPWAPTGIVAPLKASGWREDKSGETILLYVPNKD